ncbi:MAG: hypothetical protein ACK56F_11280, partial [bacterium]
LFDFARKTSCSDGSEVGGSPVGRILRLFLLFNIHLEHLGAEGERLGLLDELLVGGVRVHAHHDGALLRVDLGVQLGVPDEVDDPALSVLGAHVQLLGQHAESRFT